MGLCGAAKTSTINGRHGSVYEIQNIFMGFFVDVDDGVDPLFAKWGN